MIRLVDVEKSFDAPLLRGVSFEVPRGSSFGLIGPGASGKSVILKLLCGLLPADAGHIHIEDREITALSEDELLPVRQRIGMVFQNYALFDFMTVGDNVAFPLVRRGGVPPDEIRDRVAERLRKVGLAGTEDKLPSELSGGMKRRAGIARATVARPDVVIYDQPTAGLDPVTTSKIYDLVRADQEETGCTVIAVSSDVNALLGFASQVAMLHDGRIRYQGRAADIRQSDDPLVHQFVRGSAGGAP